FADYCDQHGVSALPAHPKAVAAFLAWMATPDKSGSKESSPRPYALTYIRSMRWAIKTRHQLAGLTSPCDDPAVNLVLAGISRYLCSRPKQAFPALPEHMRALAGVSAPPASLPTQRDQAFLAVAAAS